MVQSARNEESEERKSADAPATPGTNRDAERNEERRSALKALVTLGGLAYAGALVVPAAGFVIAPATAKGASNARWIRVGRLTDLPVSEPRRLQIVADERDAFTVTRNQQLGSVWMLRKGDDVRAFSATCPHLGCAIDINGDKKNFGCPCHASRFTLEGTVEAGPSPRGMDSLATRIVDGWIEVDFRRYRQGIVDRQEVS